MSFLLYFFAAVAAAGFVLSLASHVAALAGQAGPLGDFTWTLHLGALAVWLPAALVARQKRWKALLRGWPPWIKYVLYAFVGYAVVNFCIFLATHSKGGAGPMPPPVVRGFSGHWMALYATALAILYSGAKTR